jgi:hypothetical protein
LICIETENVSMRLKSLVLFAMVYAAFGVVGCGEESSEGIAVPPGPVYLTLAQIDTTDGSAGFLAPTSDIPTGALDLRRSLEIPGYANVAVHDGKLFVANGETFVITRYEIVDDHLVASPEVLSLQGTGIDFIYELMILDAERAFVVNEAQYEIIEWNPTTMKIVDTYDISAMMRDGWGDEHRGSFLRKSDGKIFFLWTYTNDRIDFINNFILGVLDTTTGSLEVLEDEACPTSAGFGGFFDEKGDLYLLADSFGGFTYFDVDDPKEACIERIRDGESAFDTTYTVKPTEALGGTLAPWGFYYAGHGVAFTTGVDPSRLADYNSVFEFIFAPIHEGYTLDLEAGTATHLDSMPPDAVGFDSVTIDDVALVPRTTGTVEVFDVDATESTIYVLDGATGEATPRFTMPGQPTDVVRLR